MSPLLHTMTSLDAEPSSMLPFPYLLNKDYTFPMCPSVLALVSPPFTEVERRVARDF